MKNKQDRGLNITNPPKTISEKKPLQGGHTVTPPPRPTPKKDK